MFKNKISYSLLIFLINLSISNQLIGQYSPYFQNYSLSQYSAGNQNWSISKGQDDKLYIANNRGLLVYDGMTWNLHEIPNKTTIRSVLAHKDRIYVGSYEEFGYWKKNGKGILVYTSLSHLIDQNEFLNEEFWQIIAYKDAIIFRSFINIYVYKNDKIIHINPPSTVLSCDVVNEKIYISTLRKGIYILEDEKLIPFIDGELMMDTKVISINDYNNDLFITTSLKGCFIYKNGLLQPWRSEINSPIKEYQLNSFSMLNNGKMIFGTIKNGVYVTDNKGYILFHISKENGLINNTILDQLVTDTNELWLGLDNGLASINLDSPHTFYNDVTGKLGAVYDVISFKNTMYIGSNTGLYYLDTNQNLQFIEGSQGQVWSLKEIDGQLLCGHNNGTYLVENKKLNLISNHTGGWVIKKVPEKSNMYMQGTYAGIVKFEHTDGVWNVKHMGRPIIPIRFLVFEDTQTAWIAHAYKGLYRIKFNNTYDSIKEVKSYANKGLNSEYNVRVYKLKSDICFKTNSGWQKYEPLLDSIVSYNFLNDNLSRDSYIISNDDNDVLALKNKELIDFKSFSDANYGFSLDDKYFKKRLIVGYENISKINDSIYALNLNDGYMLINSATDAFNVELQKPVIEYIEVDKSIIEYKNYEEAIEIPFNSKNITISLSSAKSRNHFFEYSITTIDDSQWYPLEKEKLELSTLNSGNYKVLFRTSNSSGQLSPTTSLEFIVLPPWYATYKGFLIFLTLILALTYLIYWLHKRKLSKEQRLMKLKLESEQMELLREKTLENDKKIVELKNEALKNEVKLKSKQLANTAMALVKKNEALQDLKSDLLQSKGDFGNAFSFRKIVKKLDNSIGHKDEWKVFEYNFNQVHEEFFKELKSRFPKLTHKDLKICAYIKMNLSTKEIAPLLNISTRGVETQRYRLKRKLNLDSDKNLTDYLSNIK